MPKIPYIPERTNNDDPDYEVVSFEDFDKSPGSKTDLLTLNDNINYRLYYGNEKVPKLIENDREASNIEQFETSLSGSKNCASKRKTSFIPFGTSNTKIGKNNLFSGVIPKTRVEGESSREHRYQRFSGHRNIIQQIWDHFPGLGSGVLIIVIVCVCCVGVWWTVVGTLGGTWGEEHYRKLWERAHPNNIKTPLPPSVTYEKILPEYRYHDHNNLSTKNKNTSLEAAKATAELNKNNKVLEQPSAIKKETCLLVTENSRFDCYPQNGVNEKDCIKRGCCWAKANATGVPYCYYPPNYDTFHFINMTENKHGMSVYYEKSRPSGYPNDFDMAKMDIKYLTNDIVQIKIYDAEKIRFEPPYPEIPMMPGSVSDLKYRVQVESSKVGFKVIRKIDNITVINTQDAGGLILSDKMLQISSLLPTTRVFGLGEKRSRFMTDINWQTYTLFNHDVAPKENTNLYGSHPFYIAMELTGHSNGMLLLNSNAMDIVLQPTPAITYRTIGGILNLLVFLGPTPSEVISQYTSVIGRPFMPPYWSLGFHLCKYNYGSLKVTQDVWQNTRDAEIPFDVQWNDLDYMNNSNDFTYDKIKYAGLPAFVDKVHKAGMHYIVLIDPGVSASEKPGEYPPYDRGIELDIFVKNSSNLPFIGKVWNKGTTVFPDFTHPSTTAYWVEMMFTLHHMVPFDGAWIDMNEPSNFLSGPFEGQCLPEKLPYTPYLVGDEGLHHKTLCMEARHYAGPHYDWHNLYALTEAISTNFALTEIRAKRPFIISRSSFVGLGRYAGHWSGDISSEWHDMRMTIPEMLSFSLFGVPMMGADICGFNGNTTVELCKRWMQLGAFYPFSRNHNSDNSIPQDPVSMGDEVVQASRTALRLRYRLLPYYYSLFWRAHVSGHTVVRPLFFEFPSQMVHDIDNQFLIGPYVMVSPILTQGATTTKVYFPPPNHWFNIIDGTVVSNNVWMDVDDNKTVTVRGGAILPLQDPPKHGPVSTSVTRSAPLQLFVAPDTQQQGWGELYWDDGDSLNSYEEKKYSHIEFKLNNTELASNVIWWGYGVPSINKIYIVNQIYRPTNVTVNGQLCKKPDCQYKYISTTSVLELDNLNIPLYQPFNVKWGHKHLVLKPYGPNGPELVKSMNGTVYFCQDKDCSDYEDN